MKRSSTQMRIGAVALLGTGVGHLALVQEHFREKPVLGYLFLAAFVLCAATFLRLRRRAEGPVALAGAAVAGSMAIAYVMSRSAVGLAGMHETWDIFGIACLALDIVAAVGLTAAVTSTRRRLTAVGFTTLLLGTAVWPIQAGFAWGGSGTSCANSGCTTPFAVALPVPATLAPSSTDSTTDYYTITEKAANASIIPGKTTPVWTYNGTFPGPTIKATSGRQVQIHLVNNLSENTNLRLHGAHVSPASDGGPTDPILPGGSRDYVYPNQQTSRTEWYHDHAMDVTGAHVYKGLAGMYLITDSFEQSLNLPAGSFDVPLVLQDRKFNSDGTLAYTLDSRNGGFMGDVQLVNGAAQPYFKVQARKYRFRFLNGSNARYYNLALSNGQAMTQIGNETGLYSAPLSLTSIPLAPAERADVVIDFSKVAVGTSVTLKNSNYNSVGDPIRFDVTSTASDTSTVPATLRPFTAIPASQSTVTRNFDISQNNGTWVFNGLGYDPNRIDASPTLNGTETWVFNNRSGDDHPIHMHDVNFQVLNINGSAPSAADAQWKETVNVPSWGSVKVIAKFTDFTGAFVFHCHILEHEDKALMSQFKVT